MASVAPFQDCFSPDCESLGYNVLMIIGMQAMPQLTDRSRLPNIVDPVIKNTMDLKHLYQVICLERYI